MKLFRPMLGRDCKREEINFPTMASKKLDGIRCIFHPELGMVSRSLKQIKNKQLQEKFEHMKLLSKDLNVIFDGELYLDGMSFQNITSLVMTENFETESRCKKLIKESSNLQQYYSKVRVEDDKIGLVSEMFNNPLEFHCFDCFDLDTIDESFQLRRRFLRQCFQSQAYNTKHVKVLEQHTLTNNDELEFMFLKIIKDGGEGVILRNIKSKYKFGRSTVKEQGLLKVKPFETFDAVIIGVFERLENINESFKNELGQSTKRNTKADKKPTGIAAGFTINYRGVSMSVTLTGTEAFRREIWENSANYLGMMIEFKGMLVGAKDVPRHPVFERFREDRD